MQKLRDDQVRDLVVDGGPEEYDALGEQARVDVEGALAARRLFNDHGDQRAHQLLLATWGPEFRGFCRLLLLRRPNRFACLVELGRDRLDLGRAAVERLLQSNVVADAVSAALRGELFDVLVALAGT